MPTNRFLFRYLFTVLICSIVLVTEHLMASEIKIIGEPNFMFLNNHMCTIRESSNKDEKGKKFAISNIDTDEVRVISEKGGSTPMKTIFDSNDLVTLQLVASGTGSVDTIHLDKKTGIFIRTQSGMFMGPHIVTMAGNCK